MRKAATLIFALPILFGTFRSIRCQSPADPLRTLLTDAIKEGSLGVEGTPALHIEANFSLSDYLGKPVSAGTLTTDILKPGFRMVTVHDDGSGQVNAVKNHTKGRIEAPLGDGHFMMRLLVDLFLHPGPTPNDLEASSYKEKDQKFGQLPLRCITLESSKPLSYGTVPQMYCLSMNASEIRFAQQRSGLVVIYNDLVHVLGHTVAKSVTVQQRSITLAKLSVTKFATAPALKEADFPKQADSDDTFEELGSNALKGRIVSKVTPHYPEDAKRDHISGTVYLHIVIGKDGSVERSEVISAPSGSTAEAALEAVRQWKYFPCLVDGVPVRVDTSVMVNFSFGI